MSIETTQVTGLPKDNSPQSIAAPDLSLKTNSKQSPKPKNANMFDSTSYHLMKNLPEVLQDDLILQQLLHPKTSDKFNFSEHPNVQKLTFKEQPTNEEIVKIEGNIVTQKITGNHTMTYDKTKMVVQSQWMNCVMDSKAPELTQAKDGIYIKHYNQLSLNPEVFKGDKTQVCQYQSATMASPQVLSHNFTNVFIYRPKERIFNVDFTKNAIYPAVEPDNSTKKN